MREAIATAWMQNSGMAKNKRKRNSKSVLKHDHAIREFIDWYCSEPRLAFNRTVVTRYRISFEQAHSPPPPSTSALRRFGGLRMRPRTVGF